MSEEPEFISQTAEPMNFGERREWFSKQAHDATKNGATFHRFAMHPEIPHLTLYEGWKMRPEDQGEPRFQLTSLADT